MKPTPREEREVWRETERNTVNDRETKTHFCWFHIVIVKKYTDEIILRGTLFFFLCLISVSNNSVLLSRPWKLLHG